MKIENVTEAMQLLNTVRDYLIHIDNEDEYNAMSEDLFKAVTDAMYMCRKFEKFDTKRKETNEMYMMKAVYKQRESDKKIFLDLEHAYSINEFTHDYHIYEVITKRVLDTNEENVLHDFDYINKILVLCDFDRSSCYNKETVEDFDELITDLALDIRFNNVEYNLRQIS